jgi:hypothetical protein
MAMADEMLLASWRVAIEELRDAAKAASDSGVKQRLAERALELVQQAELLRELRRGKRSKYR